MVLVCNYSALNFQPFGYIKVWKYLFQSLMSDLNPQDSFSVTGDRTREIQR